MDLISRQAAIDAVISLCDDCDSGYCGSCRVNYPGEKDARKALEDLPSAQPEIVRCKECKWYELPSHNITENCVRWMESNGILLPIKPNDYCSYAERRTDG